MRDIALVVVFVCAIPYILKHAWAGVVMWVWLSVMNPHRLTFGFAHDMQFAFGAAILTFVGLLTTKDRRHLPLTAPVVSLALFTLWMCLTSLFPYHIGEGFEMWSRVMKIMLMTFVALIAIQTKRDVHWIVWVIVISLGFYGTKGGFFTLINGGTFIVWGPESSFIEGNNELALALVMTIPLMRYVQVGLPKKWQRHCMTGVMLLCALSALGSHSRGALVAIAAMSSFLWLKSRNKFGVGLALVCAGIVLLSLMPPEWFTRMDTIATYDEDQSAQGRINAWWMAFNLARSRFLGGGYEIYDPDVFSRFAPNPLDVHAAHSIYFQVLGEHGFVGLALFVSIGAFTWRAASDAKRKAKGIPGLEWIPNLMDMVKVSMIGYGVGGAFLSLAYFDVPYYVMVVVIASQSIATRARKSMTPEVLSDSFGRRDRFGTVEVDPENGATGDPVPVPAGVRPPRPRDEWRGQGAYHVPRLSIESKE